MQIKSILDQRVPINSQTKDGKPALIHVAEHGHFDLIKDR